MYRKKNIFKSSVRSDINRILHHVMFASNDTFTKHVYFEVGDCVYFTFVLFR